MNFLVIGREEFEAFAAVAAFAQANPLSMDDMLDTMNGDRPAPGDIPGYSCIMNNGYKVVFTIEVNSNGDPVRHLSVSCPDKLPNPMIVALIMRNLGFKQSLMDCKIGYEKLNEEQSAIWVGELINQ